MAEGGTCEIWVDIRPEVTAGEVRAKEVPLTAILGRSLERKE